MLYDHGPISDCLRKPQSGRQWMHGDRLVIQRLSLAPTLFMAKGNIICARPSIAHSFLRVCTCSRRPFSVLYTQRCFGLQWWKQWRLHFLVFLFLVYVKLSRENSMSFVVLCRVERDDVQPLCVLNCNFRLLCIMAWHYGIWLHCVIDCVMLEGLKHCSAWHYFGMQKLIMNACLYFCPGCSDEQFLQRQL